LPTTASIANSTASTCGFMARTTHSTLSIPSLLSLSYCSPPFTPHWSRSLSSPPPNLHPIPPFLCVLSS
jgi:hypothetical protein